MERKLKIVIIGSAHPLRGGGIATFNERLAQVLSAQGHEVTICSFSLQYPSFLFPGKSQFTEEPAPKGLRILSIINSVNPLNWVKVGKKLRDARPDLVIVRFWLPFFGACFGTILRYVKGNKHTKVVSIIDNIIPHEHRPGDKPLTNYFLKPVDAFLTMSKDVLSDLKKFVNNKPALYSPHPLYDVYGEKVTKQEAMQRLGLREGNTYLLFFGFIRKYKGLDLLLQAMADPRIKGKNIQLIVAGEYYGDEAYYQELIERLGIRSQLHLFTSFIPNDEIKYYFSAADVVVQPYRTATQSGISQIAYHFEKPMIVTNVGGLPEIVPHGKVGLVVAPDEKEIATAILEFEQNNAPGAFEQHIKAEKKKYEWDTFVAQLFKLIE